MSVDPQPAQLKDTKPDRPTGGNPYPELDPSLGCLTGWNRTYLPSPPPLPLVPTSLPAFLAPPPRSGWTGPSRQCVAGGPPLFSLKRSRPPAPLFEISRKLTHSLTSLLSLPTSLLSLSARTHPPGVRPRPLHPFFLSLSFASSRMGHTLLIDLPFVFPSPYPTLPPRECDSTPQNKN